MAAGEVLRRGALGAAWHGARRPGRGGSGRRWCLRLTREANGASGNRFRRRSGSPEKKQGRRDKRRGVEEGGGASEERSRVREESRRSVWVLIGGVGCRWAGKTGGGGAARAPAKLELEEGWGGPVRKL